jgi:hypothetical protein
VAVARRGQAPVLGGVCCDEAAPGCRRRRPRHVGQRQAGHLDPQLGEGADGGRRLLQVARRDGHLRSQTITVSAISDPPPRKFSITFTFAFLICFWIETFNSHCVFYINGYNGRIYIRLLQIVDGDFASPPPWLRLAPPRSRHSLHASATSPR